MTAEARRAKISGTVVLRVELRSDGTVGDVLVCKSLGYGLDEEAVRATRQLTFTPASKAGVPVTTWATVAVSYSQR